MKQRYILNINGRVRETDAEPLQSLLDVLRENLRLTGTKKGCNEGECGSCTVMLDGKPVVSCMVLIGDARDKAILTIEGLSHEGKPHPIQLQMVNHGGVQCGYCTPGIIMSAYALLNETLSPTDDDIKFAISGNICRCTGYNKIVEAVRAAAADLRDRSRAAKRSNLNPGL
ncbi:MAG: (2Fe-2S)-binding protein [Deltaproteobacteria bacterium]|nr:(2Fe-2S)-binding protein [Deltaproteobacteria bacterium]